MTNAEKYLKENVYIEDILSDFGNMYADNELKKSVLILGLKNFFDAQAKEEQAKPQLTEDERVILRNLHKEYKHIKRDEVGILYVGVDCFGMYDNLFQFIKERRRV